MLVDHVSIEANDIQLFFGDPVKSPSTSQHIISHYIPILSWLVVSTPLKNMSSSVGMMTFPTEWKNVPNHQPATIFPLKPMGVQPCATTRSFPHLHQLIGFEGSRRKDTPVPTTALCQEPRTSSVVQMVMIFNGDLINHYRMGPPR